MLITKTFRERNAAGLASICILGAEVRSIMDFPATHWTKLRTTNVLERLNREIRRRTRVVGTFPDGNSALMLVCARLRHVVGTIWGTKRYMSMRALYESLSDTIPSVS